MIGLLSPWIQLTEQGARYPVYEWVYKPDWPIRAKFEQFLRDKKDFQDEGFGDPDAREEISCIHF